MNSTSWKYACLAVSLLLLAVVGWVFYAQSKTHDQTQNIARIHQELGRAQALAEQARKIVLSDSASREASLRLWTEALASADQVVALLQTVRTDESMQQSVANMSGALRSEAEHVRRDCTTLDQLQAARDGRLSDAYAAAFREYGIDVVELPAAEAAEKIQASRIPRQLAGALDDWLLVVSGQLVARKVAEVTSAGDTDPFRARLRAACAHDEGLALAALAKESSTQQLTVPVALLLAEGLRRTHQGREGIRVLERAKRLYPDDFWLNFTLGVHLLQTDPARADEAERCLAAATARRPEVFFSHANLARALAWQGKFPEARTEFAEAIRIKPDDLPSRTELAQVLLELGETEQLALLCKETARLQAGDPRAVALLAEQRLREQKDLEALELVRGLVDARPQLAEAHRNLGDVLLQLGQLEPAAEAYRAALARSPDLASAQIGLGNSLVDLKQFEEAEQALGPALKQHAQNPEVQLAQARLLFAQNKAAPGLEAFGRAVRLRPAYWKWHLQHGDHLLASNEFDRAIQAYARALELKPDTHAAQFGLGECYRAKNVPLTAVVHYQQAIVLAPQQARYHHGLGLALFNQGLFAQALPAYEQALILEPENPEWMAAVGLTLQRLKNYQDAIPLLRRAAELMPRHAVVRNLLGEALHQSGDAEAAIAMFREATEIDSQMAAAWTNLGNAHLLRKELEPAGDAHRRAREIEPSNAAHSAALGGVLRRQGRTEAALMEFRRAIQIQPGDARIYLELGLAYQEAGRVDEAQGAFRQAVWLDPDNPTAHVHYGLTYLLQGNLDEAVAALERGRQCKVQLPMTGLLLGKTLLLKGEFSRAQLTLGVVSLQSSDPSTKAALPELVNRCTALLALEPRKAEIQTGRLAAPTAAEALDYGLFCAFTQYHGPAVDYFRRAFGDQPALLEEPEMPLIAARAALNGAGASASPEESARLRQLALQWAGAALTSCEKHQQPRTNKWMLIGGTPNTWRHHLDFDGVHSPVARGNLPAGERLEWEKFWDEADAFRPVP